MPTTVVNKLNVKDKGVDTLLELGAEGQNVEITILKNTAQTSLINASIKDVVKGYCVSDQQDPPTYTFYEDADHIIPIEGDTGTVYIDITIDAQTEEPKNDYYYFYIPTGQQVGKYELVTSPKEIDIVSTPKVLEAIRSDGVKNKMDKDGSNSTNHVKFNGSFTIGNRKSGSTIGAASIAEGTDVIASGDGSHAEGADTIASGNYSHAEGSLTQATRDISHAEGRQTQASGFYSHSEGVGTIASATASHAEGNGTTASGEGSHAEGHNTVASGRYSYARGDGFAAGTSYSGEIVASGNGSSAYGIAEGSDFEGQVGQIKATGQGSLAHGLAWETGKIIASGLASHAEGINTTASGNSSHAEGTNTTASGDYSHAEGYGTTANGDGSHAEGYNTVANGDYSFVGGKNMTATQRCSFVFGNGSDCKFPDEEYLVAGDYGFGIDYSGYAYNQNNQVIDAPNGLSGCIAPNTQIYCKINRQAVYLVYVTTYITKTNMGSVGGIWGSTCGILAGSGGNSSKLSSNNIMLIKSIGQTNNIYLNLSNYTSDIDEYITIKNKSTTSSGSPDPVALQFTIIRIL